MSGTQEVMVFPLPAFGKGLKVLWWKEGSTRRATYPNPAREGSDETHQIPREGYGVFNQTHKGEGHCAAFKWIF